MRYRQTRLEKVIALLVARKHERVPLPEIQRAAGAQHGARLREARNRGYVIDNVTEHVGADVHSWYILVCEPGETRNLFPDPPTEKQRTPYRDPEEAW